MKNYTNADLSQLQIDLLNAVRSTKKIKSYCDYAFSRIYEYIGMDSASVNLCAIKGDKLSSEKQWHFYKQSETNQESDEKLSKVDCFATPVIKLPKTALQAIDFISTKGCQKTSIFKMNCNHFDLQNGIAIGAKVLGHKDKYIILYLFSGKDRSQFTQHEISFLDIIFPVFFSTLLFQLGFICEETLVEQVMLLNKFSNAPESMKLLKLIAQNPSYTRKEYAKVLKIKSISTLDSRFQTIFEKLEIRGYEEITNQQKLNLKYQVFEKFIFLRN